MSRGEVGQGDAVPDNFGWERRIAERATSVSLPLSEAQIAGLASHARAVLRENALLHLTTIVEPEEFLERHIGESLEGAAMVGSSATGLLLDLGSGNGYPGIPIALAVPGLRVFLAEASTKRARFLSSLIEGLGRPGTEVHEQQVQRGADIFELGPIDLLTSRATGGWERILPRLAGNLAPNGKILLWSGENMETIAKRVVWRRRLAIADRRPLPGRDRSFIWCLRATD